MIMPARVRAGWIEAPATEAPEGETQEHDAERVGPGDDA